MRSVTGFVNRRDAGAVRVGSGFVLVDAVRIDVAARRSALVRRARFVIHRRDRTRAAAVSDQRICAEPVEERLRRRQVVHIDEADRRRVQFAGKLRERNGALVVFELVEESAFGRRVISGRDLAVERGAERAFVRRLPDALERRGVFEREDELFGVRRVQVDDVTLAENVVDDGERFGGVRRLADAFGREDGQRFESGVPLEIGDDVERRGAEVDIGVVRRRLERGRAVGVRVNIDGRTVRGGEDDFARVPGELNGSRFAQVERRAVPDGDRGRGNWDVVDFSGSVRDSERSGADVQPTERKGGRRFRRRTGSASGRSGPDRRFRRVGEELQDAVADFRQADL